MVYLKFETPKDVTNPGYEGMNVKFLFQVIELGHGARYDSSTDHSIVVEIVGKLSLTWGFGRRGANLQIVAAHLFEYARGEVVRRLIEGSLKQCHVMELHSRNAPSQNPFDPAKLTNPDGAEYEIDLSQAREMHQLQQKEKRSIGFNLKNDI